MYDEKIIKAYIQAHFKVQDEIKKLQAKLDDHNAKTVNLNWAHVGDIEYMLDQLKQLNEEEE